MGVAVMSFGGEGNDGDDDGTTVRHRIAPDTNGTVSIGPERAVIRIRK